MSAEEIKEIIQVIPECIIYIYPGYLTMFVFLFLRGKNIKEDNYIWIKVIAISYIYIAFKPFAKYVISFGGTLSNIVNKVPGAVRNNLYLICISIIVAYIWNRIIISDTMKWIFNKLKISTTFYDNEFEMLSDFNKGAWIRVYLKDDVVVYEGSLGCKELEDGKQRYISLQGYYKYLLQDGKPVEPYIEDNSSNPQIEVIIFYDSIKRIERLQINS